MFMKFIEASEILRKIPRGARFFELSSKFSHPKSTTSPGRLSIVTMASKGLQMFSRNLKTLRAFNSSSKDPLTVSISLLNAGPPAHQCL